MTDFSHLSTGFQGQAKITTEFVNVTSGKMKRRQPPQTTNTEANQTPRATRAPNPFPGSQPQAPRTSKITIRVLRLLSPANTQCRLSRADQCGRESKREKSSLTNKPLVKPPTPGLFTKRNLTEEPGPGLFSSALGEDPLVIVSRNGARAGSREMGSLAN